MKKRRIVLSLICLVLSCIVIVFCYNNISDISRQIVSRIVCIKYHEEFDDIVIYLEEYSNVYLNSTNIEDGRMFVYKNNINDGEYVVIEDQMLKKIYTILKKANVKVISKNSGRIMFQKWSTLDNGYGIMYSNNSINDEKFIIKHIYKDKWWYYETQHLSGVHN